MQHEARRGKSSGGGREVIRTDNPLPEQQVVNRENIDAISLKKI